jgi:hypothetical protein
MKRISQCAICGFAGTIMFLLPSILRIAHAADDAAKATTPSSDLKLIKPEDAKDYEGQDVIVEFNVVTGRELSSGMCFLNSISDFSDPTGFTAVITPAGMSKFKQDPKTEKPASYFKLKTIRVSGKVVAYQKDKDSLKKYEIKIDDPAQIKIMEEPAMDSEKK